MTLKEVISKVLERENNPLSSREIYERIIDGKLYEFKSKTPVAIVNSELRKNAEGVHLKKSSSKKMFRLSGDKKFVLLK